MHLPSLSEFTLRSQRITVYMALKSIFITSLSVQQVERLQTPERGSLCRRQLSPNKAEGSPARAHQRQIRMPPRSSASRLLFTGRANYKPGIGIWCQSGALNQLIPEC